MSTRMRLALVVLAIMSPSRLSAQTMITFEWPVNLTKLSPEVQKVRMSCLLLSAALVPGSPGLPSTTDRFPGLGSVTPPPVIGTDELPVVGGQVVSTFRVVFVFPAGTLNQPVGTPARYYCELLAVNGANVSAFVDTPGVWNSLKPPVPSAMAAQFVW